MSDARTAKKLQLLKQIRSRYHEDQYDLSNRERILYGRSSRKSDDFERSLENDEMPDGQPSFFRLRLLLAAGLLGLVIFMDMKDISVAGITSDKIFQAISANFEERIEQWMTSEPSI